VESEKRKDLDYSYYVPRHEFEIEKNEIYKDLNKKAETLRDKIEEVDDKHLQNFHQIQRNLDQYVRSTDSLNESVRELNQSFNTMSKTINENIGDIKDVKTRVEKTESTITEKELLKEQRRIEIIKSFFALITTLLGAGGLISWLGPLIFGK